jgi:hypothetical protein
MQSGRRTGYPKEKGSKGADTFCKVRNWPRVCENYLAFTDIGIAPNNSLGIPFNLTNKLHMFNRQSVNRL